MMLLRRQLVIFGMALAILGCSGTNGKITVEDILKQVETQCGFRTSAQAIVNIILTVVTSFEPAAGAAATVAAGVGKVVVDSVCAAVEKEKEQRKAVQTLVGPNGNEITVIVNGIPIKGEVVKK